MRKPIVPRQKYSWQRFSCAEELKGIASAALERMVPWTPGAASNQAPSQIHFTEQDTGLVADRSVLLRKNIASRALYIHRFLWMQCCKKNTAHYSEDDTYVLCETAHERPYGPLLKDRLDVMSRDMEFCLYCNHLTQHTVLIYPSSMTAYSISLAIKHHARSLTWPSNSVSTCTLSKLQARLSCHLWHRPFRLGVEEHTLL